MFEQNSPGNDTPRQDPQDAPDRGVSLQAAADLMPWSVSIVFHVGLLLVLMAVTMLNLRPTPAPQPPGGPVIAWTPDNKPDTRLEQQDPEEIRDRERGVQGASALNMDPTLPEIIARRNNTGPLSDLNLLRPGTREAPGTDGWDRWGRGNGLGMFSVDLPSGAKKVAFVIDNSGSMFDNFAYVQEEMVRFINKLRLPQSFTVVFFADGPADRLKVAGFPGLIPASEPNRKAAVEWIRSKIAASHGDGTHPEQALQAALAISGGPPEVIYLLTDGQFDSKVVMLLRRLNDQKKVTVNTFAYISQSGEDLLRQIAGENGGRYRFVSAADVMRN